MRYDSFVRTYRNFTRFAEIAVTNPCKFTEILKCKFTENLKTASRLRFL
ncbi:hypothetical protein CKA32_001741 [Geitlerinema sp. FC II]|nr:hypothetical protein CKA32_001741 [Geitlerinema sp. FC II]